MTEYSETDLITLGSRIREMRQAFGLSQEALAREASVSVNYVRALEEDDYGAFGAKVYALGFLKKILFVITASGNADWLSQLDSAWESSLGRDRIHSATGFRQERTMWHITSMRVGIGLGGLLLATFLFFVGMRLIDFVASPSLVVEKPEGNVVMTMPFVILSGRTDKESRLTVSGRELTIDQHGRFEEKIELQPGINRLEFISENRFGKMSRVLRYVLAE